MSDQAFSPVVGMVLTQMMTDRAAIERALHDNFEAQILSLEAELYAIRTGVDELLMGPWMPTSEAIRGAVMYPPKVLIDEYKAQKRAETS